MSMSKSSHTSEMVRYTVYYTGTVQGVGFRYSTSHVAQRHDVAGYVQNLADGRVKLVAEGDAKDVEAFLQAVNEALSRYIQNRTVEHSHATGEFGQPHAADTFGIRY